MFNVLENMILIDVTIFKWKNLIDWPAKKSCTQERWPFRWYLPIGKQNSLQIKTGMRLIDRTIRVRKKFVWNHKKFVDKSYDLTLFKMASNH